MPLWPMKRSKAPRQCCANAPVRSNEPTPVRRGKSPARPPSSKWQRISWPVTEPYSSIGRRPVARMTEDASRIEAESLSHRIAVSHPSDELGRLGTVLNALLERLERSFQQQKQLLADTSHELRTPITIVRSEAEVTLSRERSAEEYRQALEIIHSEATHLTHLID